jgi:hypothetical protein
VTSFTSAKINEAINYFANTRARLQHLGFRPQLLASKKHTKDSAIETSIDFNFSSPDIGLAD